MKMQEVVLLSATEGSAGAPQHPRPPAGEVAHSGSLPRRRRDRSDSTSARGNSAGWIGLSRCRRRKSSGGGAGAMLTSWRRESRPSAVTHREAARGSAAVTTAVGSASARAGGTASASATTTATCERGGARQCEH